MYARTSLDLKRTTLVMVATRGHAMSQLAVNEMLRQADFADVLIYTDQPHLVSIPGARYRTVPDFPNKAEAGKFYYAGAAEHVNTEFGFFIEWDAGIYNPGKWREDFLAYDYIGAPWNTSDNHKVGNGGFMIMSKKLGDFLITHKKTYPVKTDWDVCRTYRPQLEKFGLMKYAPYELAHEFSTELVRPHSPNTFGYHGIFRWPDVLGREETVRRVLMMVDDPYLIHKLYELMKVADWLPEEMGKEAYDKYATKAAPNSRSGLTPAQNLRQQLLIQQRQRAFAQGKGQRA